MMTLTISPRAETTVVNGVAVRIWDGTTSDGVRCVLFVHRVAVHKSEDAAAFDRLLIELPPPVEVRLGDVLR